MTVRVYRWDDASAPVLNGQAGSLVALLDACLVNGYGAKAAAGWTKAFSGTNKAAYRQGIGSNQFYLRVDASGANYPRIVGYESMTDVDTGAAPFPTESQLAGGAYLNTSSTTDATARPWLIVATEKAFYLWIGYNVTAATGLGTVAALPIVFFGDVNSYKSGDAGHTMLIAAAGASGASNYFGALSSSGLSSAAAGHWAARSHTQVVGSITCGKHTDVVKSEGASSVGVGGVAYPDPVTGGMLLSPIFVHESAARVVRGVLPGAWGPLHALPGGPGDTFSGSGAMAGKQFILLDCANASTRCRIALETSDTW